MCTPRYVHLGNVKCSSKRPRRQLCAPHGASMIAPGNACHIGEQGVRVEGWRTSIRDKVLASTVEAVRLYARRRRLACYLYSKRIFADIYHLSFVRLRRPLRGRASHPTFILLALVVCKLNDRDGGVEKMSSGCRASGESERGTVSPEVQDQDGATKEGI